VIAKAIQYNIMSGRGRNTGRGHGKGWGIGRTTCGSPASKPTAKGAFAELGSNVFDYGSKDPREQQIKWLPHRSESLFVLAQNSVKR